MDEHIARELHDELGQRLAAMHYVLERAQQAVIGGSETAAADLQRLDRMLDDALESARRLVTGLRPPLLDQLGLPVAIEWLAAQTTAQTRIRCDLDLGEHDDHHHHDATVLVAAYRVLQESLTNVARHAEATQVWVRLRTTAESLELEVTDDGRGFPAGPPPAGHHGLLGMRERALALGGTLSTDNVPAGGARVRLTLPRETG